MLHIYNIYLSQINQFAMPNTIRPKKKAKMKGKNTMVIDSIYYSLLQNNYIFTLPKKSMNFSLKVI
jgi:hypothetical protein